jgi:hypothetical protein
MISIMCSNLFFSFEYLHFIYAFCSISVAKIDWIFFSGFQVSNTTKSVKFVDALFDPSQSFSLKNMLLIYFQFAVNLHVFT